MKKYKSMILNQSNIWSDNFVKDMSLLVRSIGGYNKSASSYGHNRHLDERLLDYKRMYSDWFYGFVFALSNLDNSICVMDEDSSFDDRISSDLEDFKMYLRSEHFNINDLPSTENYLTILTHDLSFSEVIANE